MDPTKINFGADGWRAITARGDTVGNANREAHGTAHWLRQRGGSRVVIGADYRSGGESQAGEHPFQKIGPCALRDVCHVGGTTWYRDGADRWRMVPPSATETVLRVCAPGAVATDSRKLPDAGRPEIGI